MTLIDRARRIFEPRREGTPGQLDQERETAVSLGLMADAKAAGAEMTDEQAIFLSSSMEGMRNRISVLLGVPDRSLAQDRELVMIQRELARLEGRTDAPVLVPREEPQTGPKRFWSAVAGVQLWHVLAVGWAVTFGTLAVQTARLENAKDDLRDSRADLAMIERHLEAEREVTQRLADEVRAADLLSQQTAANLEAERARSRAAAAAERRRQRALREVDTGGGPPDWERSLRDDDAVAGQTGGSSGGAPTGNPG